MACYSEEQQTAISVSQEAINLQFSTADVKNIISFGRMLSEQSQVRAIIALVMFLTNLPQPFVNIAEEQIDLDEIIREELSDGEMKTLDAAQYRTFELQLLSLLANTQTEIVKKYITWDVIQ